MAENHQRLISQSVAQSAAEKLGLKPRAAMIQPAQAISYDLTAALSQRQVERQEASSRQMQQRLAKVAEHWQQQQGEHQLAIRQTAQVFDQILDELPRICRSLQEALGEPKERESQERHGMNETIGYRVDGDRSVGILHLMWQRLSFCVRGNRHPMVLPRVGRSPLLCGRITALHGDLMDPLGYLYNRHYPDLLMHEVASLYVPADPAAPALMMWPQQGQEGANEVYLYPHEAVQAFLTKTIERLAHLPAYHERF